MDVRMTADDDKYTQNIHNSSTRSHTSEEENHIMQKSQQKLQGS